jgi:hypothetical protein
MQVRQPPAKPVIRSTAGLQKLKGLSMSGPKHAICSQQSVDVPQIPVDPARLRPRRSWLWGQFTNSAFVVRIRVRVGGFQWNNR